MPIETTDDSTRAARRWTAGVLLPLLTACAPTPPTKPAPSTPPPAAAFGAVADSAAATPPLDRTHWGIEVFDPAQERALYRLNAEQHFVPASNMKLIVTSTALAELGPEFRYHTDMFAPRTGDDSVAARLVVVARGDPTLSARFFESDVAPVEAFADSVYRAGIRRIAGDLVVDASYFDTEWVRPSWEVGDLPWYYAAPVAAFAIAEAAAPVVVTPGARPGEPAVISLPEPAEAFVVQNRLVTDTAGAETEFDVLRAPGEYTLDVVGTIALDEKPDTLWLSVVDPAAFAARTLEDALRRRGVQIDGGVRVVYDSAAAAALLPVDTAAARRVVAWTSPPLGEIVAGILKPSQNWIAEQLLKTLGAELAGRGSWKRGLEVERGFLVDRIGIDSTAVALVDASGLSAQNLVTPHAIVQILAYARMQPWGAAYQAALPAPGEVESTLEHRLRPLDGRVQAKTGTITHVNSLSGFVQTVRGKRLIFSILTNASGVRSSEVRQAVDRIVTEIVDAGGSK